MAKDKNLTGKPKNKEVLPLQGILVFYCETGTEGGYWAFQDEQFILHASSDYGIWGDQNVWDEVNPSRKGHTTKQAQVLREGHWYPLPDPIQEDSDYLISSLFCGEIRGDRAADSRLMEKYGFVIKYSADRLNEKYGEGNWKMEEETTAITPDGSRISCGGTPQTEPSRPYGTNQSDLTRVEVEWEDGQTELRLSDSLLVETHDRDGLHILKEGDQLVIFDKEDPTQELWRGIIKLKPLPLFSATAAGFWIHSDMEAEDWDRNEWARLFFGEYPAQLALK